MLFDVLISTWAKVFSRTAFDMKTNRIVLVVTHQGDGAIIFPALLARVALLVLSFCLGQCNPLRKWPACLDGRNALFQIGHSPSFLVVLGGHGNAHVYLQ